MGGQWEDRYIDLLTPFYFQCTEHGLIPIYHLTEEEAEKRKKIVDKSEQLRQLKMERVRAVDKGENQRLQEVYFGDLSSKVTRAQQKVVRGNARKDKIHDSQVDHLRVQMEMRRMAQDERMQTREKAKREKEATALKRLCRTINDRNAALIIQRQREMRDALAQVMD